jgi:hypothetical protein
MRSRLLVRIDDRSKRQSAEHGRSGDEPEVSLGFSDVARPVPGSLVHSEKVPPVLEERTLRASSFARGLALVFGEPV